MNRIKTPSSLYMTRRISWRASIVSLCLAAIAVSVARADELQFSNRTWRIKQSDQRVGPGHNLFNGSPDHVWVDEQGLHLTIKQSGDLWYCTEVVLKESLGYGTYVVQTNSRQDVLDANAVFGAFTWDDEPAEMRFPINFRHREIDIEDSRWGGADEPTASQFVLQPWPVDGLTAFSVGSTTQFCRFPTSCLVS